MCEYSSVIVVPMKNELDIHCHTISSGHAYSTIEENIRAAAGRGLSVLAITDHAPAMHGGPHAYHFYNLCILPTHLDGVRLLKGAEANIMDYKGNIDLDEEALAGLELVIASLHPPCIPFGSEKENTEAILGAMKNKKINIIGHPGDTRYPFSIKDVVAASKETGTLLEINNSSLKPTSFRPGGDTMIRKIIGECMLQEVPVVMGSDAHFSADVGVFTEADKLLEEMKFPEKRILNRSAEGFLKYLQIN